MGFQCGIYRRLSLVGLCLFSSYLCAADYVEPEMVAVAAGRFTMGYAQGDRDEKPVHLVTLTRPFYIGKYEVTFAEYDVFCADTGREMAVDDGWGRGNMPVINVSWADATDYAAWLSVKTGKQYRLPTEAEWEFAARGGTTTVYWWGDAVLFDQEHCDDCSSTGKKATKTQAVGLAKPNPYGLYDMNGNVWEWVGDWFEQYTAAAQVDPQSSVGGSHRVIRGGGWTDSVNSSRVSFRGYHEPNRKTHYLGFRLVRVAEE